MLYSGQTIGLRVVVQSILLLCRMLENREVDASVSTVFNKAGMCGKIVVLAVFEHKNTFRFQQIVAENKVGNIC